MNNNQVRDLNKSELESLMMLFPLAARRVYWLCLDELERQVINDGLAPDLDTLSVRVDVEKMVNVFNLDEHEAYEQLFKGTKTLLSTPLTLDKSVFDGSCDNRTNVIFKLIGSYTHNPVDGVIDIRPSKETVYFLSLLKRKGISQTKFLS